jgi:hypothetical protein
MRLTPFYPVQFQQATLFSAVLSLLFSKALASFRKVIAVCIVWTVI